MFGGLSEESGLLLLGPGILTGGTKAQICIDVKKKKEIN